MIGEARFIYTDDDMIATQRAGWRWCARWRNLLLAYLGTVIFNCALLLGLNAFFGTWPVPQDPYFVILAAAAETLLLFGLLFVSTRNHARQVLRGNPALAWNGDPLGGEHAWAWDSGDLHVRSDRGRADLAWTVVGAFLDAPEVLLLFPSGGRAFSVAKEMLAAGWQNAPKVFLFPYGGYALALPKRVLATEDMDRLVDVLRSAGVSERGRAA